MKPHCTAIAATIIASLMASAPVPLSWQVTPRNPAPVSFDRHHGETLEFRCTFTGFGELPFAHGADIRLFYQTNGMGSTWWSIPAAVSSNVLTATFTPQADPGADRLALFFGAPSNAYASTVLRLRPSPGYVPNVIPPPDVTSWSTELAALRSLIDYSQDNADLVATIEASARPVIRIVTEDGTRIMDATGSVFAVSSTPGVFVATNLFLMAPGAEFVFTNINAIAWGLVGGSPIFQQMIKYLAYDATTGRWLALGTSFGNYLAPEYVAGFNASFQSPTDTPFDAPSFGLYDNGFIGDASHLEGTFYRVAGATVTSLVDRVVFESSVPQTGVSTNDVKNIVTAAVTNGEWTVTGGLPDHTYSVGESVIDGRWYGDITDNQTGETSYGGQDLPYVPDSFTDGIWYDSLERRVNLTATRGKTNVLGLARLADLPALTNGLIASESDPTVHSWAKASRKPTYTPDEVGAYSAQAGTNLSSVVSTWETYWDGDEVRVTVTNYDSSVHLPSLYLEQKIENTDAYRVVWDERTRWASNDVQMAALRAALDEKADRAWGFYDSHTGYYAPDDYTWISSPKIAIAGGLAYQRTLTTDGAVWVLVSNGMVAETGGEVTNGFFRIKDDEGNTTFEIVRGNKRTVGATAAGIRVTRSGSSNVVTVPYNVVSEEHPTVYGTTNLSSGEWTELAATWLGQSGAWTAQVSSASATFFIKGEYETGGETYIKNVAPISAESGIYCTDKIHKVRPVYNSGTITWEVVTP